MGSFDLYRKKMQNNDCCQLKFESSFILNGTSSTIIYIWRTEENKQAALIINDKEGPDSTLVFTYLEDDAAKELIKTDYFTWKNNTYFVYEDIDLVHDVNYKKQKAYQCNVSFMVDDKKYYGYFVGSLAKYLDNTLQSSLNITDNEKPILVLPQFDWLETGKKIIIKNKPWKIIDFDIITNDGIAYISLDRDFISKQEDIIETDEDLSRSAQKTLKAGIKLNYLINYGYFKTEPSVEIITKKKDEVEFIIPHGIKELTIYTKDMDKMDIEEKYKVVI